MAEAAVPINAAVKAKNNLAGPMQKYDVSKSGDMGEAGLKRLLSDLNGSTEPRSMRLGPRGMCLGPRSMPPFPMELLGYRS